MDSMFNYYKNAYPALYPNRMQNSGGSDSQLDKYGGTEVRYPDVSSAVQQALASSGATNVASHSL